MFLKKVARLSISLLKKIIQPRDQNTAKLSEENNILHQFRLAQNTDQNREKYMMRAKRDEKSLLDESLTPTSPM